MDLKPDISRKPRSFIYVLPVTTTTLSDLPYLRAVVLHGAYLRLNARRMI